MIVKKVREKRKYFTQDTEDAIIRYNSTSDFDIKNKIYEEEIHYAFFKLTQNIIHTFKFYNTDVDNLEHLQHEIIIFLLSKIHLFDHTKGSKAYSYFGTIVKRWLILHNDKIYKKKIQSTPIEDIYHDENYSYTIEGNPTKDKLSFFIDHYIIFCSENLYKIFPKGTDAQVADAVLELFRKRDNIDLFNKKALYIYIHEQVNVKTPKITKIVNTLQEIFKSSYVFYLENDYINFEKVNI
jgi:hypothetical protein